MIGGRRATDAIGDRRAVSSAVAYTLTLSIALVLVSGLLIGGTTLVEDQRDRTMNSQLATLGQQVAGSYERVDRLNHSTHQAPGELNLTVDLPSQIMGSTYFVEVSDTRTVGDYYELDMRAANGGRTVTVLVDVETEIVSELSIRGGESEIGTNSSGLVMTRV